MCRQARSGILYASSRTPRLSIMAKQALYKVVFVNHNQVYELYARQIFQSDLYGFIEIEDYVFGEKSSLIVDTG
jgi:hypothetical protein